VNVAAGQYDLRATFEGLSPALRACASARGRRRRSGSYSGSPSFRAGNHGQQRRRRGRRDGANNVDAITIDTNMLESLPVFDNDFCGRHMSQFLDAGSSARGVTIVVTAWK